MTDLYSILEIEKDATEDMIKKSYKIKALQYHPDRGGDEEKFKVVNKAYEVLSDKKKRYIYDKHGEKGLDDLEQEEGHSFSSHDIFNQFFQQQQSNSLTIVVLIEVTLQSLYTGINHIEKVMKACICNICNGSGSTEDNGRQDKYICNKCNGTGITVTIKQIGMGIMQQVKQQCLDCNGKGKKIPDNILCHNCVGEGLTNETKKHEIYIQPGMSDGDKIKIDNEGNTNIKGHTGDLIFLIKEISHNTFKRINNNLIYRKSITLADSLCGAKFLMNFLDDRPLLVKFKIIIDPLKTYKLVGWGMPKLGEKDKGDLFIEFDIEFPDKVDIKPEFKKQIKKYLKTNDEEIDSRGIKTATVIEELQKYEPNLQEESIPVMQQQTCNHQ